MLFYAPPIAELDKIPKPKGARSNWGYCGVAALSAATEIPPRTILGYLDLEYAGGWPGYTPSYMVTKVLTFLGHATVRIPVKKEKQTSWPPYSPTLPSRVALGRIYYGEGKYSGSHWVCFRWVHNKILLYDNRFRRDYWLDVIGKQFFDQPTKLKCLYFVM